MATVDNTFGVLYDVTIISAVLYGAGCLQGWFYFRKYLWKDPLLLKLLVAAVLVCDTCQQALLSECMYIYLVKGHMDPLIFGTVVKSFITEIIFSSLIALLVQQFYSYRIYLSNDNWVLGGFVSLVSVGAFVTLTLYIVKAMKMTQIAQLITLKPLTIALNSVGTAADLLISIVMVWLLQRQKAGSKKTTDMLNRLIIFSFNTGLPTSFCALACVISINAWPDTLIYIFWYLMLGRLYTNSLLVSLNSREYIRSTGNPDHTTFNLQSIRFQSGTDSTAPTGEGTATSNDPMSFRVDKSTHDPEEGRGYFSTGNISLTPKA
ncbi:hypothetical protein C8R43DRAFT_967306 [Mycena crocata]|nr:hypothetical protein C8R43DRAFT_967306 [Mycena crocata]